MRSFACVDKVIDAAACVRTHARVWQGLLGADVPTLLEALVRTPSRPHT